MPNRAVAAYLRELRKRRGLTQERLAQLIGVSKRTIERLERAQGDTAATHRERIVAVLKAVPEDVTYLATNPEATVEEALALAEQLVAHSGGQVPLDAQALERRHLSEAPGVRTYIRLLREHQGITRASLATHIGISPDALADWEAGDRHSLPSPVLYRAAAFLGATRAELERIVRVPERGEIIALQLAEERLSRPQAVRRQGSHVVVAVDRSMLRRMTAIEGLLHYTLGLLKRALPDEADAIERTSALWFQTVGAPDESEI